MTFPEFIKHDVSLKPFNTFGLDVTASFYMDVHTTEDLMRVYRHADLMRLSRLIIGGGSNLVLTRRFEGLVLRMATKGMVLEREDDQFIYVRAAAGERWHDLVLWTLEKGWGGLENLSWIPGTVGAAPVQNIGAYGAELQDCFFSLCAFDFETGSIVELNKTDCQFSYRTSIFKQAMKDRLVILDVTFALPKSWSPNVSYAEVKQELKQLGIVHPSPAEMGKIIVGIRQRKLPDPSVLGNAGSFFRNPTISAEKCSNLKAIYPDMPVYIQSDGRYRVAAGWLIDQCGWKGKRMGDVGVCEKQALVLVNYGHARGQDILTLAKAIENDVFNRFAVRLEPEPVFV